MSRTNEEKARAIARFLEDHKGIDTAVVDVRQQCGWADFFVITTARSLGHLRGLAGEVQEAIEAEGLVAINQKKTPGSDGWLLIDCSDIIIHIMSAEMRAFYSLEKLWAMDPASL